MKCSNVTVACARLYTEAMQLIEDRPEIAYTLLIAAAEALAGVAMTGYEPPENEKACTKGRVRKRSLEFGLNASQARELAILATDDMRWFGRRFRECLKRYTDKSIWTHDDLFIVPESLVPHPDQFDSVLRKSRPEGFDGWAVDQYGYLTWEEVERFCVENDLRNTQAVFAHNKGQIY